jgi:uncharacterized membrane protein HdeD (DUF308 family)
MEDASKVMYKIANVFNWIALVAGVIMLVCGIVFMVNPSAFQYSGSTDAATAAKILIGIGIWAIIWPLVLILLTRVAYKKNSSQNWDILFLILGILSGSIFYLLGGIFGIAAKGK